MVTWKKRVTENNEYYELIGAGEKIQEYGDLRYKGKKEQSVLWTKRNRRENTRSMVIWDTRVRENKVYYDMREKSEREQRVLWFEKKSEREQEYCDLRVKREQKVLRF